MNIGQVVRDAVGQVAPTLGAALGGPLGGAVGRQVSQVLTGRPDAPEAQLRAAVERMTPEQVTALIALEEQATRREQIHAADRTDARNMDSGWQRAALGAFVIGSFVALIFILVFVDSAGESQLVVALTGSLATMAMAVISFNFGSSAGSKSKDALLGDKR